ncbi:MAG: hypothetical protein HYW95_00775 [Candidatus Wildermuthbacteria bacterium]|nr:hypothetical protein [Candidatus Wildermuthbacteria bacterium]
MARHKRNRHIKLKIFICGIALLVGVLAATYIFQVNDLTKLAYQIAGKEQTLRTMSQANKTLSSSSLKNSSLRKSDEVAYSLGLQRIDRVSYLRIEETSVAKTSNPSNN